MASEKRPEAMRLTTTLRLLHGANAPRYAHLLAALGDTKSDHDKPINLLTVLEINGFDNCLWALRATTQDCDVIARLMAADFVEAVLPIFEKQWPSDDRPRKQIIAERAFARGEIGAVAGDPAWAVAGDPAWAVAGDAAWVAWVAARDAAWVAWVAAGDAAGAAARDAWVAAGAAARDAAGDAVRDAQRQILVSYLLEDADAN
jgi:hypothetical protein